MPTSNIYSLGSSYVYRQYSMSTNELFSLNYTISNQQQAAEIRDPTSELSKNAL